MKIPFVPSGQNRSGEGLPAFELQNLYPAMEGEELQSFARQGPALVQVPGASTWATLSAAAIRGLFRFPGAGGGGLFAVNGTNLVSVSSGGSPTTLGTISGTDPIIWDMIRDTVLVCADGKVWFTTGGAPTQVTDADLGTIGAICALDGRLIAARDASDTFVWSNVFAPGTIGSLAFATAEGYGDRLVRPVVYQRNLYLLGERSVEIWGSTGDNDAPFVRVGGAVEPYGCAARHSVATLGEALFFVANNVNDDTPFVMMMTPEGQRVSDIGIETLLRSLSTANLAAVRGMAFRIAGASFYSLTMPGLGTWWLHVESGTWLRRRKGTDTAWIGACCTDAYGRLLVGSDAADGRLYALAKTTYSDAGDTLVRLASCYLPAERPTPIATLLIDAATRGAAGATTASVRLSDDDGQTWRPARTVSLDKSGARAGLSFAWGRLRRPGALLQASVSGDFAVALFNALVNEDST